jgi:hypothetical protein
MSKRFPIPEFDRDQYKNRAWTAPTLLGAADQMRLKDQARKGDNSACGAYPVALDAAVAAKFKFEGPHLHAVMCVLPNGPAKMVGRSWAWPVHRALVLDAMDSNAQVIADWTTPRPMSTRLGPDAGVDIKGGAVYVIIGNRYGNTWIGNRTSADRSRNPDSPGFDVLSACGEDNNDFHACNLSFRWGAGA